MHSMPYEANAPPIELINGDCPYYSNKTLTKQCTIWETQQGGESSEPVLSG